MGHYNGYPLGTVTILKVSGQKAKDVKYIWLRTDTQQLWIVDTGDNYRGWQFRHERKILGTETMNGTPVATADLRSQSTRATVVRPCLRQAWNLNISPPATKEHSAQSAQDPYC